MDYKKVLVFIGLLMIGTNLIKGQNEPIAKEELGAVISSISEQLKTNYVFPEVAEKMASYITGNFKNGSYDDLLTARQISARLSDDLVEISKDKHIRIGYHPELNKALSETGKSDKPKPEVIKKWKDEASTRNFDFAKVEILPGNIGLITLNGFSGFMDEAGPIADAVMAYVANSDALIFDLRANGGGSPEMINHLTSYLLKERTHLNSFYFRASNKITKSWTTKRVKGKKMDQTPVYILTSNRTFSAAEEFTYNLKHLKRATVVGEISGGGANPGGRVSVDKNFVMFIPLGRAINPITETNWEGVGVIPHIKVSKEEALNTAHLEALNGLLAIADDGEKKDLELLIANQKALSKNISLSVTELEKYVGDYAGEMEPKVYVEKELLYISARGRTMKLQCIGEGLFIAEDNIQIQFEQAKDTSITRLKILIPNGPTMDCPRK